MDRRITAGTLVIDHGARDKNAASIASWQNQFGPTSVRYVINHAKIATVTSASGLKFLLRGSMNLNYNPRFEQFDITEGGADYDLIHGIEEGLPVLAASCSGAQVWEASGMKDSVDSSQLQLFATKTTWKPTARRPK